MSKEKENKTTPNQEFSLLSGPAGTAFDDGMSMEFIDETSSNFIENKTPVVTDEHQDTTEIVDESKDTEEKKEPVKETKPETKGKTEPKKETKEEVEETEEPVNTNTQEEEVEETGLHSFYSWAAEQGILDTVDEGKVIETEEDLKEVVSKTINKGIEEYKSSHPEEVQKFIEFVDNGGNPRDFHRLYYEEASWKDADLENESHQEQIIRATYERTGMDKDDIESQIQDLKDLGKLDTLAKKMLPKLIAEEDRDKESLLEAQKEYQRRQAEQAKKAWDDFKDNLYKKEEVNGFKLTNKVKDDLWNFMTKVDKKTGKTALQQHNETNQDAQVLYAYLAMNNWDITKLEKQVKTKVVSDLSKKLKNVTDSRNKISKGFGENFEDKRNAKNNFSLFKTAVNNNLI